METDAKRAAQVSGCSFLLYEENVSIEVNVFNHLGTDVFVQFASQDAVLHHEVLLDDGRSDLYVERLVLDEDVGSVALD